VTYSSPSPYGQVTFSLTFGKRKKYNNVKLMIMKQIDIILTNYKNYHKKNQVGLPVNKPAANVYV